MELHQLLFLVNYVWILTVVGHVYVHVQICEEGTCRRNHNKERIGKILVYFSMNPTPFSFWSC